LVRGFCTHPRPRSAVQERCEAGGTILRRVAP
jgi:hypothetical protein